MKNLLKLEELVQLLLCIGLLIALGSPWWCYLLLAIGPDISMLGYLIGTRTGAICYNLFHHKGVALLFLVFAKTMPDHGDWTAITGLILYGHASMDRIFGYGLKFGDSFQHTHLGWIGKQKEQEQGQ
jgi:hypothetical protein